MNKKFYIYLFFLVPIMCTSCDWFNEPEKQKKVDVTKIEEISPALKQRLNEQDSLYSELVLKIDSLTAGLNQSKGYIEELQSEIKELKSPSRILASLALFALLLSIVAIVLSIIRTNNKIEKRTLKEITIQIAKQIKDLEFRMNRAEVDIKNLGKKTEPTTSSDDKRLSDLDVRLRRIEKSNNAAPSYYPTHENYLPHETLVSKETEFMRVGYAKVNSSKYFVEIFNSQHEDCVYKINFVNKEEGEFDIISLSKIKTINDLKEVLDLASGSCLLNEASSHIVVERGRCKKIDDNTWEVTKKLVIKVFK